MVIDYQKLWPGQFIPAVMCIWMCPPRGCLFTMGIEGKVLKHPVTGCADGPASNTEAKGTQASFRD